MNQTVSPSRKLKLGPQGLVDFFSSSWALKCRLKHETTGSITSTLICHNRGSKWHGVDTTDALPSVRGSSIVPWWIRKVPHLYRQCIFEKKLWLFQNRSSSLTKPFRSHKPRTSTQPEYAL